MKYIHYNHLNLPTLVMFNSGDRIIYVYDATGVKQSKQVIASGVSSLTYYAGNYIYEQNNAGQQLAFFSQPEGYVEKNGSAFSYVYQHKDHLGNIRLSYKNSSTTGIALQIVEENNYYPFGLKHKGYNNTPLAGQRDHKYGFGGKEEQSELGLDWIDITARNYDPALGRWMNLDPLAEQMRRHSPYNYAFDNPIYFIDPDGMAPDTYVLNESTGESTYIADGSDDIVVVSNESYDATVEAGQLSLAPLSYNNKDAKTTYENNLADGVRHTIEDFDTGSSSVNRNIQSLDPRARTQMILTVMQARIEGIDVQGGSDGGHRTYAQQNALYAKGRTAGGKKVTNARGGGSNHNFGMAMDVAILEEGKYLTKGTEWQYGRVGEIAEKNGLEWGGRWTSPFDPAHIQVNHGYKMSELRNMKKNELGHIEGSLKKSIN